MRIKRVDCIILAMLKEERELFLENNNCFIYNKAIEHEDFLEFNFFDNNNNLRTGVFCCADREMGNNEASKLFYKISRKYQSELFINIGVVGYVKEVSIGDVIIVNDCYSLCEKNVANDDLQKTDAKLDETFIKEKVCNPLKRVYLNDFKKQTKIKLDELRQKLDSYIKNYDLDENEDIVKSLKNTCNHKNNTFKLGACATYHSVVKDETTRAAIEAIRKTNVVDMEAYYFYDWFKLICETEYPESLKNSKMFFLKSISDTAIDKEKAILEKLGSRELAMSNIYDIVTYFLSNIYIFSQSSNQNLSSYFENNVSSAHVDKLINYTPEADKALDNLCEYLLLKNTEYFSANDSCIDTACSILEKENQILVFEGNPGKGKSTFISYVYKKFSKNHPAVFISVPELFNENQAISLEQSLFLLERILKHDNNITIFIDGVEGSRKKKSDENKEVLDKIISMLNKYGNRNISLCIGAWHTNDVTDIKDDILNRLDTGNDVHTFTFRSISAFDENIEDFIKKFAEFYKYSDVKFDSDEYINGALKIVTNEELRLRYVDFRMLYIFAKERHFLTNSTNIFDFIKAYCKAKAKDELYNVVNNISLILKGENLVDQFGLLTKNIYSRAFIFSQFIYQTFVKNDRKNIKNILSDKYILSDYNNLFLEYILNTHTKDAKTFVDNVLDTLQKEPNCQFCSKIQLLYNISSIKNISGKRQEAIKEYILDEIKKIETVDLSEQEIDTIIGYRTLSIILNNKFGISIYLQKFNSIISDTNKITDNDLVKKINRNFHLLYYSQTEFTYDQVEDNVSFEPEIVWNTCQILKRSIISSTSNPDYIETCALTLLQLINHIKNSGILSKIFSNDELNSYLELIDIAQKNHSLLYIKN